MWNLLAHRGYDNPEPPATDSPSSKKQHQKQASKKKVITKGGRGGRLKIKEKTVLTDVFSKYGLKAALASTRKS
ncbi:hypothetical protein DKX38_015475 [Salix brachista]|uniref:Uncharacterized protein n=1 Tax=Salix brachista TaxID=2182728 RepID=A0A5N5L5I0_9ROSI|nr:hypothetical protein DKX38_015475 [Salix brachista]